MYGYNQHMSRYVIVLCEAFRLKKKVGEKGPSNMFTFIKFDYHISHFHNGRTYTNLATC